MMIMTMRGCVLLMLGVHQLTTLSLAFIPPKLQQRATTGHSVPSFSLHVAAEGEELTVALSTEIHALEVFDRYSSESSYDDGSLILSSSSQLHQILCSLDVEATQEEAGVLFRYLDEDGDGELDFEDFLPWYLDAAAAATAVAESFQSLLLGRRTIEEFDLTPVSNDVLTRAIQCALAAPNRSCSEPWRFLQIGPKTVAKFAELKAKLSKTMETEDGTSSVLGMS
jgi:hypothetical protein